MLKIKKLYILGFFCFKCLHNLRKQKAKMFSYFMQTFYLCVRNR
nr:MAG TPA: hypothetical protein [Bacteriophage sp.]